MIIVKKSVVQGVPKKFRKNHNEQLRPLNNFCGVKTLAYLLTATTTGSDLKLFERLVGAPLLILIFLWNLFLWHPVLSEWEKPFATAASTEGVAKWSLVQNRRTVLVGGKTLCISISVKWVFLIESFFFGTHSFCGKPFREEKYRGEQCEEKAQWEHPVKLGF